MHNAGGLARPAGTTTGVYFGVRELGAGGPEAAAVLEFDFLHCRLAKFDHGVATGFTASFGDIKKSQTDGTCVTVSFNSSVLPAA